MSRVTPYSTVRHALIESPQHVLNAITGLTLNGVYDVGIRHRPWYFAPNGNSYGPRQMVATGATGATTWEIIDGSLDPGMSLSSDGIFSGTPTEQIEAPECDYLGIYSGLTPYVGKAWDFTVQATDSIGAFGTQVVKWYCLLSAKYEWTWAPPTGATVTPGPPPLTQYATFVNWGGEWDIQQTGEMYSGGTRTTVPEPEYLFLCSGASVEGFAAGLTSCLYPDGLWRHIAALSVAWTIGTDEYRGVVVYDSPKGSLYGSFEDLTMTRWEISMNNIPGVDPPYTDGSVSITVT